MGLIRQFAGAVVDTCYPPVCLACDGLRNEEGGLFLCKECLSRCTPIAPPICTRCGLELPGLKEADLCGRCLLSPPPFERARFGLGYDTPLSRLLIQLKYSRRLHVRPPLVHFLVQAFETWYAAEEFDVVIPIPVTRQRLAQRGFNQALMLARGVGRATGLKIAWRALRKTRNTLPQVGLTREERAGNLKDSFAISARPLVRAQRILLVDDVLTTGATIREASRTLMSNDAARVDVLVLLLRSQEDTGENYGADDPRNV